SANFLTLGKTTTHSDLSSRSLGMLSGIARISFNTVAQARNRSSSLPCAASVVDSARNAISSLCMGSSLARLAGGMELQDGVQRRHDRYRQSKHRGPADDGALQRLDLDP